MCIVEHEETGMACGMDLGSRSVKVVCMESGRVEKTVYDTVGFYRDFGRIVDAELSISFEKLGIAPSCITVTGYGRNTVRVKGARVISEVRAHTMGAMQVTGLKDFTLLDIGGQDTKVAKVAGGMLEDFTMNDKCAASSGRYIENMAAILEMGLDEISLHYDHPVQLSATCAIFGESEIIQRIAEGAPREALAAGVNLTIAKRVLPMLNRFPVGPIVFSGGVAKNGAVRAILSRLTHREIIALPDPSFTGALGCASQVPYNT